jgi:hypothetical protein
MRAARVARYDLLKILEAWPPHDRARTGPGLRVEARSAEVSCERSGLRSRPAGAGRAPYKDAEVRAILTPLAALAEKHRVALVGILHLTKAQQRKRRVECSG